MIHKGQHTKYGVYCPTNIEDINLESVVAGKKFLDLGSGDGRIVKLALDYGADAYGAEIERELYDRSLQLYPQLKGRIFNDDMFNLDFSEYCVLYYYLNGCSKQAELFDKITREFRGVIISYNK